MSFGTRLALFALALTWTDAIAQPNDVGFRVRAPLWVTHTPLDKIESIVVNGDTLAPRDTLHLMWRQGPPVPHPTLGPSDVVQRQVTAVGGGARGTLTYTETLTAAPLVAPEPSRALARPGSYANVYPDPKDPSVLHVNYWLSAGDSVRWQGPDGEVARSREEMRSVEYYYKLKNRQPLRLKYAAWSYGAMAVPIRVYPGYASERTDAAGDRVVVAPDTRVDLNANLYFTRRWGSVKYSYNRHAATTAQSSRSFGFGGFLGISAVEIDSATTRSSESPLTSKRRVPVLSSGLVGVFDVRGVQTGVFLGMDVGLTSAAQGWDYHARPWVGLGIGFNILTK